MKPLRMELEGFARFAERQVVSFEDLTLFAIAGPTGAGKTLILDALSFALYGVTPRLGQKLEGLISNGRDRLVVDLQFEAGGGTYRVVRTMERKPSGTVSKSTRIERLEQARWLHIPETEKLKEANAKLEQIVGLDFQAFTRSILLPQGKFDEFLHGEPGQRRRLLKELLDLSRVDRMREEAGRRDRDTGTQIEFISGRLESEGLEEAPGRLSQLKEELAELEVRLRDERAQLEAGRTELSQMQTVGRLHAELEEVHGRLERQLEAARRVPELQQELAMGRKAESLLPLLDQVGKLEREAAEAGTELARLSSRRPELQKLFDQTQEAARQASLDIEESEPKLRARLLEAQQLLPLAQRLERLGGAPVDARAGEAEWHEERFETLQQLHARLPGLTSALKRRDESASSLEQLTGQEAQAAAALQEASAEVAAVVARGQAAAARIRELEAEVATLERQGGDAATALRDTLVSGDACPVCGQTVHDLPEHSHGPLREKREQLQLAKTDREGLLQQHTKASGQTSSLEARREAQAAARATATATLQAARTELAAHLEKFAQAGFDGPAEALETEIEAQLGQQIAALAAQLAAHGGNPADTVRELETRLADLARSERGAQRALAQAERELLQLSGQLETKQALAERIDSDLTRQLAELGRRLKDDGFSDRDAVRGAGRPAARLAELEQQLKELDQELGRLRARNSELLKEIAGRPDRRAELDELNSQLARLEIALHDHSEQRGSLAAAIEQQKERARLRAELLEQRRKYEDEREIWRLLALDLRDDRFTDFLLGDLQRRLARRASHIIRQVTGERFDLHLSESREFEVSDAWAGGARRSATNLSGGETFIVSLALALALSDSAAGGRRLGALFLDEGFGTLDAQTLDAVASVLESLSTDGRMVGLITHVPELSQRMPARLMVRKEAAGSSLYWED